MIKKRRSISLHPKRRRKTGRGTLTVRLRVECLEPRLMLSAVWWTGGGNDGNWNNTANWSTNDTLPDAADDVVISSGALVTSSDNVTIHSLQIEKGARLSDEGGLTVSNGLINEGTLQLGVRHGANLYVNSGTLVNAPGGEIVCSQWTGTGTYNVFLVADVNNRGTITVNQSYFSINVAGNSKSWTPTGKTFTSTGTVQLSDGANCSIAGIATFGDLGSFQGNGLLEIQFANWSFASDWTVPLKDSVFIAFRDCTVSVNGTLTNPVGNTFAVYSSTINADVVNQGALAAMIDSTINGQLTAPAGSILQVGFATVPFLAEGPALPWSLELTITRGFTNHGHIGLFNVAQGSTLNVTNGTLVNAEDGTISSELGLYDAEDGNALNAVLENQGTLNVAGSDLAINQGTGASAYTLTNEAGSTIDVAAGRTLTVGGQEVLNYGSIELEGNAIADFKVSQVTVGNTGILSCSADSIVHVRGSFYAMPASDSGFSMPGRFLMDGSGTKADPQLLQVFQDDSGNTESEFDDPFAFDALEIDDGTYVKLVNQAPGSPPTTGDAAYVNELIGRNWALDRNGLTLYTYNTNFAVLFSGGIEPRQNYGHYYNNIVEMYEALIKTYQFDPGNIYVLYADAGKRPGDRNNGDYDKPIFADSDMSFAKESHVLEATGRNLQKTLSDLAANPAMGKYTVSSRDHFFFYSFDHGFGTLRDQTVDPVTQTGLYGWGDDIRAGDVAAWLKRVGDKAGYATYAFAQCFSGGIIAALNSYGALGKNRFACAAANYYEYSNGDGFAKAYAAGVRLYNNAVRSYVNALANDPFCALYHGEAGWPANGGVYADDWEHPFFQGDGDDFPIFYVPESSPTLTSVQALNWVTGSSMKIGYNDLLKGTDASDSPGNAISFLVTAVNSGALSVNGSPVVPGATMVGYGDTLTWTPTASATGVQSAFTVRAWDGLNVSATDVPVNVNLIDPGSWHGGLLDLGGVGPNGNVNCGVAIQSQTGNALVVTLANRSSQQLQITGFALTGSQAGGFHVTVTDDQGNVLLDVPAAGGAASGSTGFAIPSGATFSVTIVLTPQALGDCNAQITFTTNDPRDNGQARTFGLSGFGVTPQQPPTLTTIAPLTGAIQNKPYEVTFLAILAASDLGDPNQDPHPCFRVQEVMNGSLTKNGQPVVLGQTEIGLGQSVVWTPDSRASGMTTAFFVRATELGGLISGSDVPVVVDTTNHAPTLATPASATPNPVIGLTTSLSVLGDDVDTGESSLTYTWATTGIPPAVVSFSPNGSHAATTTTATFSKAGTYGFTVTVTDPGSLTTTSTVAVHVLSAWHNYALPCDVDGNGEVAPLDVLILINYLNSHPGIASLPASSESPPRYYDVAGGTDGDGQVTPLDVLTVINYINSYLWGSAEGEPAGPVGKEVPGTSQMALGADQDGVPTGYGTPLTGRASVASAPSPHSPEQASTAHRPKLTLAIIPGNSGRSDAITGRPSHRLASDQDSEAIDAWLASLDDIGSDLAADVASAWGS